MKSLPPKLRELWQRSGLLGCLRWIIVRLVQRCLFERREVLIYRQSRAPTTEASLQIRCLDQAEFAHYACDDAYLHTRLSLLERRLAQGDQVWLAFDESQWVHVAWTGLRNQIAPDYEIGPDAALPLDTHSAVIYDCWTPESARGRGYYPQVLRHLTAELLKHVPEVWIYCLATNHASRRGIEKAGFKHFATLSRIRIFGQFLACRSTLA